MPRKKSAARKAKEEVEEPIQDSLFDNQDDNEEDAFTINEDYARKFEHNKKREDLHRLQEKYRAADFEDDSDASTSEEEDDVGDLNTPQIDAAILKMLSKIRNKDPDLYTTEAKFFEEAEADAAAAVVKRKQQKPTTIADVHRQTLLSGKANDDLDEEEDDALYDSTNGPTHIQEQAELRKAFQNMGDEAESDDDVLVPKSRTPAEAQLEDAQYKTFLQEQISKNGEALTRNAEDPESEEFLLKYVLNRGWIEKDVPVPTAYDQVSDVDDDWEEQAEKFETTYNFRYEQPGATEIVTHPRDITSVRRKDEKRKRERDHKLAKEQAARQERQEELNRLKNLKAAEMEAKIKQIEEVTGRRMDFDELDLEGDFDPDQWDTKMLERFNDEYYQETETKPSWDDDIDIADLPISDVEDTEPIPKKSKKSSGLTKREEKTRKRKIEALVDASVPEPMGPGGRMFRYRQAEPETFGLTVEDILFADDKKLNEYVGLKKLATFKPRDKIEKDRKKYGAKKRAKQFQKELWSQSRWRDRATGTNEVPVEEGEERKSKKNRKDK